MLPRQDGMVLDLSGPPWSKLYCPTDWILIIMDFILHHFSTLHYMFVTLFVCKMHVGFDSVAIIKTHH